MFDFNGDGKTDLDEQYTAYKIYEDVTKDSGTPAPARGKFSGFDILILCLIGYAILNTVCSWFY
jgi:hypothetical protein